MNKTAKFKVFVALITVLFLVGVVVIIHNSKRGILIVENVAHDTTFHVSTLNFTFPSVLKLKF